MCTVYESSLRLLLRRCSIRRLNLQQRGGVGNVLFNLKILVFRPPGGAGLAQQNYGTARISHVKVYCKSFALQLCKIAVCYFKSVVHILLKPSWSLPFHCKQIFLHIIADFKMHTMHAHILYQVIHLFANSQTFLKVPMFYL